MKIILKSGKRELADREIDDATAVRSIFGNSIEVEYAQRERNERISLFDYDVEIEA